MCDYGWKTGGGPLSFKQNQMPQKVASICYFRVKKAWEAQSSKRLLCQVFPNYWFLLTSLATLHLKKKGWIICNLKVFQITLSIHCYNGWIQCIFSWLLMWWMAQWMYILCDSWIVFCMSHNVPEVPHWVLSVILCEPMIVPISCTIMNSSEILEGCDPEQNLRVLRCL